MLWRLELLDWFRGSGGGGSDRERLREASSVDGVVVAGGLVPFEVVVAVV